VCVRARFLIHATPISCCFGPSGPLSGQACRPPRLRIDFRTLLRYAAVNLNELRPWPPYPGSSNNSVQDLLPHISRYLIIMSGNQKSEISGCLSHGVLYSMCTNCLRAIKILKYSPENPDPKINCAYTNCKAKRKPYFRFSRCLPHDGVLSATFVRTRSLISSNIFSFCTETRRSFCACNTIHTSYYTRKHKMTVIHSDAACIRCINILDSSGIYV